MNGIVNIDIHGSTKLLHNKTKEVIQSLKNYDLLRNRIFKTHEGAIYDDTGDGATFFFPTPFNAVQASLSLLNSLIDFNEKGNQNGNQLATPIFVRIGVHQIAEEEKAILLQAKRDKQPKPHSEELSVAGKLQKNCPIGRIAVSSEAYAKIGSLQYLFRPSSIKIEETMLFVLVHRTIMGYELELFSGLPQGQMDLIPPIITPNSEDLKPDEDENVDLTTLHKFFENEQKKVLVVLGSTIRNANEYPGSPIASAATSDAVGIIEVMTRLRTDSEIKVGIAEWEDTSVLASQSNLLIVGGLSNLYSFAINSLFKTVHFARADGRMFAQIVATSAAGQVHFGHGTNYSKDSALVLIARNPFGLEKRTLLWVAGITGKGTQAAARLIWELACDDSRKSLRRKIGDFNSPPVACVVAPNIPEGPWRISDYKILWAVDRDGHFICVQNRDPNDVS